VYSRNLAEGHGFVYNIGGERVEGFTSLLWVLIGAIFFYLSNRPEFFLLAINIIFVVVTNVIAIKYIYRMHRDRKDIVILLAYLIILLIVPDYIVWMTFPLMETGLWSFLLTITAITVLSVAGNSGWKYSLFLSLLIGTMLLTRPEAIVWGALYILLTGLQVVFIADHRKALWVIGFPVITYCATIVLLTIFRLLYFGYPLPNTYYAKVSPSFLYNLEVGFEYFLSYINSGFLFAVVVFCTIVFFSKDLYKFIHLWRVRTDRHKQVQTILQNFTLGAICVTGLVLPILPGGDHFNSFRFYQPIYPLLIVYFIVSWIPLMGNRLHSRWVSLIVLVTVAFFVNFTHDVTWQNVGEKGKSILVEFRVAERGREQGILLTNIFLDLEEYPSIGTVTSGAFKMTYPGDVIDLMGLNNLQMGHSPGLREGTKNHAAFDSGVFFTLQPQIVGRKCDELKTQYLPGLSEDQKFHNLYECVNIKKIGVNGIYQAWIRVDFLARLYEDDQFKIEPVSYE